MNFYLNKNNIIFYAIVLILLFVPYVFRIELLNFSKIVYTYIGTSSHELSSDIYTQNEKYLAIAEKVSHIQENNETNLKKSDLFFKDMDVQQEIFVEETQEIKKVVDNYDFETASFKIDMIFFMATKKAKINGKLYFENDSMDNEVKVKEIQQYSIVLEHQGKERIISIKNYLEGNK